MSGNMRERETTGTRRVLEPQSIAQTLGTDYRTNHAGEPELVVEDSVTGLHVRLTLHPSRDAVSLYVRVGHHFGGFLHLGGIEQVDIKREQREVHFLAPSGKGLCRFAISHGGHLLALANVDEDAGR